MGYHKHLQNHLIKAILLLWACAISPLLIAQEDAQSTKATPERLFHIARSLNRNLVCYDVHLTNGQIDGDEPVNVYWLNREENPGKTNGISFFQKKAYGYKVVSNGKNSCKITLNAYPEKELTICKKGGKYVCLISINNKRSTLESLYVKAHPNNSLKVEYVELFGTTTDTSEKVSERVRK